MSDRVRVLTLMLIVDKSNFYYGCYGLVSRVEYFNKISPPAYWLWIIKDGEVVNNSGRYYPSQVSYADKEASLRVHLEERQDMIERFELSRRVG